MQRDQLVAAFKMENVPIRYHLIQLNGIWLPGWFCDTKVQAEVAFGSRCEIAKSCFYGPGVPGLH